MAVFLNGLSLKNYRGIGPTMQRMGPFQQFNFFIGANNAGKSTILNFLRHHVGPNPRNIEALDVFAGGTKGLTESARGIPIDRFVENALSVIQPMDDVRRTRALGYARAVAKYFSSNDLVWVSRDIDRHQSLRFDNPPPASEAEAQAVLQQHEWQALWNILTGNQRGSLIAHWLPQTLNTMIRAQSWIQTRIDLIPAIREIGSTNERFEDFSGRGLIDRLVQLQSPDHDQQSDREAFAKINGFLQTVTGRDEARIEIPHHRQHVLVHMDQKILPLSSLGTGIHEVIMIAAFCNIAQDQIVCIEEPEIHLHPVLQRKLIKHLQISTNNQYFIATHSPSFIDTPDAAIFHVTNDGSQTQIRHSTLRKDRFAICADLGHRASDIIQSNAVIWVEGPSDRIYLRHWISAVAPELVEGTHFSIMFYGGRLLSHLSADDEEISEFIQLRSLNRHLAIIFDSDRTSAHARINATKTRVKEEFESQTGSLAWVTKGREIENYIPHALLQDAVRTIHPNGYTRSAPGGQFDHALYFYKGASTLVTDIDKIKVARLVCTKPADLSVLDLNKRIKELVELIRLAND